MNRIVIGVVAALVVLYLVFSSMFVVNARQQAIVSRFGEITNVYEKPGLYFKLPTNIVDKVQIIENRLLRYDLESITLQVSDGKFYNVDAFLTYKIDDPVKFRESVSASLTLAEQRIATRFESALRQVYGRRDFNAALSNDRTQMMQEVRQLVRPDIQQLGIEVVDVRILRTDLTDQVLQQTYDRMKAERLAEAALLRARGREEAQRLRAIADRQAVEIVAEAQRDGEIIRGEGDAERNATFAKAFSQDPNFFEFYRSMQAYDKSLPDSDTTMLLSPKSEFFRFLNQAGTDAKADAGQAPESAFQIPPLHEEPGAADALPDFDVNPVTGEPVTIDGAGSDQGTTPTDNSTAAPTTTPAPAEDSPGSTDGSTGQ